MRQFLVLSLFAAGLFAQDWNKPPFTEWRDQTVLRVITDSPWAKVTKVKLVWTKRGDQPVSYKDIPGADRSPTRAIGGSPVGGIGGAASKLPSDADLLFRWASALPVRQATALYKQRGSKVEPAKLNEMVGDPGPDYVIEVRGVPVEVAHSGVESVETIARQSTYLKTATGRVIKPSRAEVSLEGATLTLLVHFTRTADLRAADREVDFVGNLQILEFKVKFKLQMMAYLGNLEL